MLSGIVCEFNNLILLPKVYLYCQNSKDMVELKKIISYFCALFFDQNNNQTQKLKNPLLPKYYVQRPKFNRN